MITPENAEVTINGRLQFDTALHALAVTALTDESLGFFETIKGIKAELDAMQPLSPEADKLYINLKGGKRVAAIQADLLMGLELVATGDASLEQKIAAQALLEILRPQ